MPTIRQRITPEQLTELDDAQKEKLMEWWQPQEHDVFYGFGNIGAVERVCDDETIMVYGYAASCPKNGLLPLLTIGQCIELLRDKVAYFNMTNMFVRTDGNQLAWGVMKPKAFDIRADELIDALWQAVKTAL